LWQQFIERAGEEGKKKAKGKRQKEKAEDGRACLSSSLFPFAFLLLP
jgi:hypothetical protein